MSILEDSLDGEQMTLPELLNYMRGFAIDHEPHGWPAVQMRDITRLCDACDRYREALETTLGNIRSLKGAHPCNTFDEWERVVSEALGLAPAPSPCSDCELGAARPGGCGGCAFRSMPAKGGA